MPAPANKIRILFYSNCLGRGGAHQSMLAWFDLLKTVNAFELDILCDSEGWFTEQLRTRNLPYTILPMPAALGRIKHGSWKNPALTGWRIVSMIGGLLRAWCRVAFRPNDIVVLTGGRDFIQLFPLALRRRRHAVTVPQTTDWAEIPVCKLMCRVAAKTYAISDSVAQSITAMGIAPEKVSVHPLIYTTDHASRAPTRSTIRAQLNLPTTAPVIGMTGVIRPHKGQKEAVLILEKILRHHPTAYLLIAGVAADDETSRAYEQSLRELVIARGLNEHVHFLGWRNDIPDVMRAMDLMLVPSHDFEGVPRVILEGLEASLPIIATDLPQFREVLGKHRAGFLHPIGQLDAWCDDITSLLADSSRRLEAAQHARTVWQKLYSWQSARTRIIRAFGALAPETLQKALPPISLSPVSEQPASSATP